MDAHEQQLAVSVDARPSAGHLAEGARVRARAGPYTPQPWSIDAGFAARAAEPISELSDYQLFATTGARMKPNGATRAAPIQYP